MSSAVERISIKKERISSHLVYNIFSLGKMAGKAETFSWRSVEDELAVRKFCCYFEWCQIQHLLIFSFWV